MPTPEELARKKIDEALNGAGWAIQDSKDFNRNASLGVAVREFQLKSGPCDYLLFVGGKAAGVIEATETRLSSTLYVVTNRQRVGPLVESGRTCGNSIPWVAASNIGRELGTA